MTEELNKTEWQSFFDRISKKIEGRPVRIEVAGLSLGDQIEAEFVSMIGITYDPKDDIVEVATEEVDHLIRSPRQIFFDAGVDGLQSVEVIDTDDNRQIIVLQTPLALPAT
ncbi:MAG: DUF5335 domain-containing protein [Thiotrichales bacterium]